MERQKAVHQTHGLSCSPGEHLAGLAAWWAVPSCRLCGHRRGACPSTACRIIPVQGNGSGHCASTQHNMKHTSGSNHVCWLVFFIVGFISSSLFVCLCFICWVFLHLCSAEKASQWPWFWHLFFWRSQRQGTWLFCKLLLLRSDINIWWLILKDERNHINIHCSTIVAGFTVLDDHTPAWACLLLFGDIKIHIKIANSQAIS